MGARAPGACCTQGDDGFCDLVKDASDAQQSDSEQPSSGRSAKRLARVVGEVATAAVSEMPSTDAAGGLLPREEHGDGSDAASAVDEHDSDSLGEGGGIKEEQGISEPMEGMPLTREEQALQTALEALHPSKAPGVMKQRATEFKRVLEFIVSSATDPSGGSLYLCGCPGTGKTQTMAHVQTEVRRVAAEVKNTPYLFPLFLLAVRYTATCKG